MHKTSTKIFEGKKKALEKGDDAVVHQVAEGRDIMSILRAFSCICCNVCILRRYSFSFVVKANMSASEDTRLPDSEILAQMSYVDLLLSHTRDISYRGLL